MTPARPVTLGSLHQDRYREDSPGSPVTRLRSPQPRNDPTPDTAGWRALTDTGAMRLMEAATNAWIAEHANEETS